MKRWFLAAVFVAMPALAQPAQDPNEHIQTVVTLKYADPDALANLLRVFGVDMRSDQRLKVITLGGARKNVQAAETAIKQLDQPTAAQKDIELTAYFVVGDDQTPPNVNVGSPIPSDLQSTVATLKTTFPYKVYYLLDALSLRTRSGSGGETTGRLSANRFTTFRVQNAILEGDGASIRLNGLYAGVRVPHIVERTASTGAEKTTLLDTGLNTQVMSVKPGQKLVVGRSSLGGPANALFLVLIANIAKDDPMREPPR